MRKERVDVDALVAIGDDHATLHQVFELADVAGPVVVQVHLDGAIRKPQGYFLVTGVEFF